MKIYLDSLDSFYSINHEVKPKQNKDYAGIGAIIFTFTVMSIVIGLSIYTAWQIAYGQELSPRLTENEKEYCESRYGNNITRCLEILDMMTPEERQYCDGSYNEEEYANVICPPFLSKSLELDRQKEAPKEPLSGIIRDKKNMSGFAGGNDRQENQYFSVMVPDNWAYIEGSNTVESKNTGFGPVNSIQLTPNEFSDILASGDIEKIPFAQFIQDTDYPKNAPLESYVKNKIDKFGIQNITSQQYTTVGKEKSIRLYANESAQFGDSKFALYLVMHDKEPYLMYYIASPKNYEKYLADFEQMVKSLRFTGDSTSEIENLSENENETNTTTNFSGANLTEFNTKETSNGNSPEELYDECVRVAGKSFCDYLFRK